MEILINFISNSELNRLDLFSTSSDGVFIMNSGLHSFSKGIHWVEGWSGDAAVGSTVEALTRDQPL